MGRDGGEVLFHIPRAAAFGIAQQSHDIEQTLKVSAHGKAPMAEKLVASNSIITGEGKGRNRYVARTRHNEKSHNIYYGK